MNRILAVALGATILSAPAMAADAYSKGGSLKDSEPQASYTGSANHSGFYITGALGIADGDRSIRRDINRGLDAHIDRFDTDSDGDIDSDDDQNIADAQAQLATVGIPSALDSDGGLTIPLIGDHLGIGDSDGFSSTVFGGGLSYLFQMPERRIGISLGIDATFYNDAESSSGHTDAVGTFTGGTALADFNSGGFSCANINTCAGQPAALGNLALTQTGFLTFDRDFDIDIPVKLHWFVSDKFALNIGAGPSWARGNLKGTNVPTDAGSSALNAALPGFSKGLSTVHDDDDTALGYVITAGAQYWVTDRIVLGIQGDYKEHTFEFDAASSNSAPVGGPLSLITRSHDSVEVEDSVYSIKATASFKLN